MTKFERDKVYKTRDGREARVICVDAPGLRSVIALIGIDPPYALHADGRYYRDVTTIADIMLPKPEPVVEWGYMSGGKFEGATSECGARHFTSIIDGARLAKRVTTFEE